MMQNTETQTSKEIDTMPTNTRPAGYDDFCKCGHRIGMHIELDNNYAPCAADDCLCDDYDESEQS